MRVNTAGINLIKLSEGFVGKAYPDPGTGGEPWTIGFGHTALAGPPSVKRGDSMTKARAEAVLAVDVGKFAQGVARYIKKPINDNQFSALVSFAYNVGLGNFAKSSVLTAVNGGAFSQVPSRLQLWVKAAGRTLPGLVKRRAAEGALFTQAVGPSLAGAAPLVSYGESEVAEMREVSARGSGYGMIDPVQGKSLLTSSTVRNAVGLGGFSFAGLGALWGEMKQWAAHVQDAGLTFGLEPETITRLAIGAGGAFITYTMGRIIYERWLKARDMGV